MPNKVMELRGPPPPHNAVNGRAFTLTSPRNSNPVSALAKNCAAAIKRTRNAGGPSSVASQWLNAAFGKGG